VQEEELEMFYDAMKMGIQKGIRSKKRVGNDPEKCRSVKPAIYCICFNTNCVAAV
jgi:hypothetical protein